MSTSNNIIHYYYLLYKLSNNKILWVVKKSNDINELKDPLIGFYSNIEKYYIISINTDISTKQFTKFEYDKYDYTIIYQTKGK